MATLPLPPKPAIVPVSVKFSPTSPVKFPIDEVVLSVILFWAYAVVVDTVTIELRVADNSIVVATGVNNIIFPKSKQLDKAYREKRQKSHLRFNLFPYKVM
jgi:hypothetical protein